MKRERTLACAAVLLLLFAAGVGAEEFAIQVSQRVGISNDSARPSTRSYAGTTLEVRNYDYGDYTTRRRVSYCRYDVSSLRQSGEEFTGCYLTWNFDELTSDKSIYVYGIQEEIDNATLSGVSWSTAPGIQNDPVPALGSEITIDMLDDADISPLLLSYTPTVTDAWLSTPAHSALTDFLNNDTDGNVTLMFVTYDSQASFYIYDYMSDHIEPTTGLQGIILKGEIIPEPATAAMMFLGAVWMAIKRRR